MFENKDSTKNRGQREEPTFRGQTLSRPKTRMAEAKAKDLAQNFCKSWLVKFLYFLNSNVFKILHFVKF